MLANPRLINSFVNKILGLNILCESRISTEFNHVPVDKSSQFEYMYKFKSHHHKIISFIATFIFCFFPPFLFSFHDKILFIKAFSTL